MNGTLLAHVLKRSSASKIKYKIAFAIRKNKSKGAKILRHVRLNVKLGPSRRQDVTPVRKEEEVNAKNAKLKRNKKKLSNKPS